MNKFDKKEFEHLLKKCKDYAESNEFHLNPNSQIVDSLIKALLERERKYGQKYCPCRRVTENQEENNKIICPCIYCEEEIKKNGHCHCFLFVK